MIIGVGMDVVDLARFATVTARTPSVLRRVFTAAERELSLASLAARFAAKEALAKCLGAPGGLAWQDAEVLRGAGGRPQLQVRGTVAAAAARAGVARWHLSLSHDGGLAVAVVVAEA